MPFNTSALANSTTQMPITFINTAPSNSSTVEPTSTEPAPKLKERVSPKLVALPSKVLSLSEFVKDMALLIVFVLLLLTGMIYSYFKWQNFVQSIIINSLCNSGELDLRQVHTTEAIRLSNGQSLLPIRIPSRSSTFLRRL